MKFHRVVLIFIFCIFLLALPGSSALAWKPKTHLFTAAIAVKELLNSSESNFVTIDGKPYQVNPDVAQAIRSYPEHFFGGVVGPDGFPDIVFGQTIIHPDNRCDSTDLSDTSILEPDENCGKDENQVEGETFTDDWLNFIYHAAWDYYDDCNLAVEPGEEFWILSDRCPDRPGEVLAFMYGFLTHAAGDVWGHTFVNEFAQGVFPSILDPLADRGIAVRHIIVEGYVGKHTSGSHSGLEGLVNVTRLNAPTSFIHQTFIVNEDARKLSRGSHFDQFLSLREMLVDLKANDFSPTSLKCNLPDPVTGQIFCEGARQYIEAWIEDIDEGLEEWPRMSLRVTNALFFEADTDSAIDHAQNFVFDHLLSMLGAPDEVGEALGEIVALSNLLSSITELIPNPTTWLIEQATGINIEAWKEFYKSPESYVNCDESVEIGEVVVIEIGLDPSTSEKLDEEMGINSNQSYSCDPPTPPPTENIEKFDPSNFAAARNTIVLSRLLLLDHSELNALLYDHHVGKIFGREEYPEYMDNIMLGFLRTIDGNHQWRDRAPIDAAEENRRYSLNGGMAIWRDCLARNRVFRTIFTDWQNNGDQFPDPDLDCEVISEPLPPVEFIIRPEQKDLNTPLCAAPDFDVDLINHRMVRQPFAFYIRVVNSEEKTLFHQVINDVHGLQAFETRNYKVRLSLGCNGTYKAGFYLFERMWSLVVDDIVANPPIPTRPDSPEYLPIKVNSPQTRYFTIDSAAPRCQFTCPSCPELPGIFVVPARQSCIPMGNKVCGQDCADLMLFPEILDADLDLITDDQDNCPTIINPDQKDLNGNLIGDECEESKSQIIPIDPNQIKPLFDDLSWLEHARILEILFLQEDSSEGGDPWCLAGLSCPGVFKELWPGILEFTNSFNNGQITSEIYTSVMQEIVNGPTFNSRTTKATSVSLESENNTFVIEIDTPNDDVMTVRLPLAIIDSHINNQSAYLDVYVDGEERKTLQLLSSRSRIIEIPLQSSSLEIRISGTQLGPGNIKMDSNWPSITIFAIGSGVAVIGFILIYWAWRYRKGKRNIAMEIKNTIVDPSN